MAKKGALTEQQKRFVEEYLIDLNATAAYKRAGYKAKGNAAEVNASRLLSNAKVKALIEKAQAERAKKKGVDAEYVLDTIIDTIERCRQARPVTYRNGDPVMVETADGEIAPAYTFESGAVLKGCELLGKHIAMWTDKLLHEGKIDSSKDFDPIDLANRLLYLMNQPKGKA